MRKQGTRIFDFKSVLTGTMLLALFCCDARAGEAENTVTVDLKEIRRGLGELEGSVSGTVEALNALKKAAKAKGDLKGPYEAFENQHKKLQAQLETLRDQAGRMRAGADQHYAAWREELARMDNPKLRDKALNRQDDAKEEFEEIIVIAQETRRDLEPFMADLRDVSSYLSTDLSADAVKSLSNTIWKLGNKSRSVIAGIQHVNSQINKTLDVHPEGK